MVWYDFAILALLVYSMWTGAQRGFVTQLAWIAALVLCFKFADKLAPAIEPQINVDQPLRHWIAMLILYLAFSLGSFMVARILNSWMEKAKFKDFDRHLGGLLGLLKGGVIAMVITFFAVTLSESLRATVMESYSGRAACQVLDTVEPITPDYFKEYLAKYREGLGGDIHEEHLGEPTDIFSDLLNESGQAGRDSTGTGGLLNDLFSDTFPKSGGNADSERPASAGDSFRDLWNRLPVNIRENAGAELQARWNSSSPAERRNLLDSLNQSVGNRIPVVVRDFLSGSSLAGQGSTSGAAGANSPSAGTSLLTTLNAIGDIYQDRKRIVDQTRQRMEGVPDEVQRAVLEDWYADLALQPDPDPSTSINTTLDERILSQLNRRGIWSQLSFELKQRLNRSRR